MFGQFNVKKEVKKLHQSDPDKEIYTVEEAAAYLHMSVSTLRKKYAKKIIRRIQQGRKIIFKKEHLQEYLEEYTIR